MSAVRRAASARPRFSGAFTEWLPAFGESWHVVHVPSNDTGSVTPFENVLLFKPPTPLMTIRFVLKSSSPRAIAARALSRASCRSLDDSHWEKIVKARESNGAPL